MQNNNITLPQGVDFDYAVALSALPEPSTYAGHHIMCDVRDGAKIVYDFGKVAIAQQANGTGAVMLSAPTNGWPVGKQLAADIVVLDATDKVIARSGVFNITIAKGITDNTVTPNT